MTGVPARREVHPIEAESYRILHERVDLSGVAPWTRTVIERIVHASADLDYVSTTTADEDALAAAAAALRAGAPLVTDVAMVAAGVTRRELLGEVVCHIGAPAAARLARREGITRSAAAVRLAAAEVGVRAVWVVGCAPTALEEIVRLRPDPLLVIGLPVGFVGAAESKENLRASGLPQLSNVGDKGGSAVAAAAVNALLYASFQEGLA